MIEPLTELPVQLIYKAMACLRLLISALWYLYTDQP